MSDLNFVFLTANLPGIFAFDRDKNVIAQEIFPKDGKKIYEKLSKLENGRSVEELESILDKLSTENLVIDLNIDIDGYNVEVKDDTSASKYLHQNLREISKECGFVKDDSEFNKVISDYYIADSKSKMKKSVDKDKIAAQTISAINDLDEVVNEFSERLREWYGHYYPELKINSNRKYAEKVSEIGFREDFKKFNGSMGLDLDSSDVKAVRSFAEQLTEIYETRDELTDYLEDLMEGVAPNITHIIGPKLGAGLISLAGSLEKLSKMPSSKIQLLGAEKALFRHLHGGGKPPKYGIIFTHRYIQNTPDGKRGKVARAIASKLMMAARTDYYTNQFKGEKYKEELEEKVKQIRKES